MRRLSRILLFLATTVALGYVLIVGYMWWRQDTFVFAPARAVLGYQMRPEDFGLTVEEVRLAVAPDIGVKGWFVKAKGESRGTILYFHGNGGNLAYVVNEIRAFADNGFDSFSIDYEGFGESTGRPSEPNLYRDADAAWGWLTKDRDEDPARIIVWGISLGGAVAAYCAVMRSPGAVVLQSTFTSQSEIGAKLYPWLPVRLLLHTEFDTFARLSNVRVPVIVVHSRADRLVPFEMAQRLFAAAREPKALIELKGPHGYLYLTGIAKVTNAIRGLREQTGASR